MVSNMVTDDVTLCFFLDAEWPCAQPLSVERRVANPATLFKGVGGRKQHCACENLELAKLAKTQKSHMLNSAA